VKIYNDEHINANITILQFFSSVPSNGRGAFLPSFQFIHFAHNSNEKATKGERNSTNTACKKI